MSLHFGTHFLTLNEDVSYLLNVVFSIKHVILTTIWFLLKKKFEIKTIVVKNGELNLPDPYNKERGGKISG